MLLGSHQLTLVVVEIRKHGLQDKLIKKVRLHELLLEAFVRTSFHKLSETHEAYIRDEGRSEGGAWVNTAHSDYVRPV